jgi:uncharacterized membrane protein
MTILLIRIPVIVLCLLSLTLAINANRASGQTPVSESGTVILEMRHRDIALEKGDMTADINIVLHNRTKQTTEFSVEISGVPTGWEVALWNETFDYKIRSMALSALEESKNLTLRISSATGLTEEKIYPMSLRLVSTTGIEIDKAEFSVRALPTNTGESGEVIVSSTYPILRGPIGNIFEFELDIRNRTGIESSFTMSAEAPIEWLVEFTPAFGESKRISSVSMTNNGNERVKVTVAPPGTANEGEYPIIITVANEHVQNATTLMLTLTGKGIATLSTANGLLNVDATAGEPTPIVFRIGNTGTAELRNLQLTAVAPDEWTVQFQLNPIPLLPPNNIIDIETMVVPSPSALPGDYLVKLRAASTETEASLDVRVTVGRSTIWGWVGIIIVIVVLGGLVALFWRLGRR